MIKQHNIRSFIKRLAAIGIATVMLFTAFTVSGCSTRGYEWSEESFSLEIAADRDSAYLGEYVTLTITFENLTTNSAWVSVPWGNRRYGLESIVRINDIMWTFPTHSNFNFIRSRERLVISKVMSVYEIQHQMHTSILPPIMQYGYLYVFASAMFAVRETRFSNTYQMVSVISFVKIFSNS